MVNKGLSSSEVIRVLEETAPLTLAETWDNVGLLLAPDRGRLIKNLLLTIDLTPTVWTEARKRKADMIVAYHPPLFNPVNRLDYANPANRVIIQAIQQKTFIYSPHTALDAISGGVNDWLADAFKEGKRQPIHPFKDNPETGGGRIIMLPQAISLSLAAERIRKYLKLKKLRVALADKKNRIKTIALCAGAGAEILQGVKTDLYWTGEMKHHDILAALAEGASVILCEHTNTERGYLPLLKNSLSARLQDQVKIHCAKEDVDPICQI